MIFNFPSKMWVRVSHEPRADNPEDRQQALGLADRFSECGAFHEAMAKYMLVHGDPDGAEYMHNMRNGAELVGAIYASQAMDPFKAREYMSNMIETKASYWKSSLLTEGFTQKAKNQMEDCFKINDLQAGMLNEMRKKFMALSKILKSMQDGSRYKSGRFR
jgi:hypothetical protein